MHGTRHSAGSRCIHQRLGGKHQTKSHEAQEREQQLREHESIDIGKSQRL